MAFNHSRRRWFGTRSCKPVPRGLPSSVKQLRTTRPLGLSRSWHTITTYSPMRHWGVTKGKKVGVVGVGGLGHMGVKFAHAFGAHVVVFTTSPGKKDDALRLGTDE